MRTINKRTLIGCDGTSTNVGPTNVGRYKPKNYKRRTVQTSDQYKRQTGTNWYKPWTSTNIRPVQTSDQYKRRTKEKNIYLILKIKIYVNPQFSLFEIRNFFCEKFVISQSLGTHGQGDS